MGRQPVLQDYGNIQNPAGDMSVASDNARLVEQRRQFNLQNERLKGAAKEKEGKDATDYITGLKVDHIGDNTIDLYNDEQVKAVQDELIGMMQKGAGINEIKMAAMPKLQKIAQGYTIAKNEYGKLTEGIKELSKDNPTGDMGAVRNIGGKVLLNTIFEFDENGKVKGYKDPSVIATDKNYLEKINTNQNLPKWYSESGDLEKGIKELPLMPVNEEITTKDKFGNKIKKVIVGHQSVFDEPILNEDGKKVGIKLKSETVPLGRNEDGSLNLIEVMPKEQFELSIKGGKARKDFDLRFNKELEQNGIDPDRLDPRARDILEREYQLKLFKRTNIHGGLVSEKEINEAAPAKNTTYNNIRVGGNKEVTINDVYGRIENATKKADILFQGSDKRGTRMNTLDADAQKVIFDYVGDPELDERNSFIVNDDGAIKVYRLNEEKTTTANPNGTPDLDEKFVITTLPRVGTNIKVQANTKGKEAVVKQGEAPKVDSKPTTGYTNVQTLQDSKGKSIQAGVKNGKWYDIKTGKPIE